MRIIKTIILCILILGVSAAALYYIFRTEPAAQREGATKQTAMLVDVTRGETGSFRPEITATGVVQPSMEVQLGPQVGGQVIYRASHFNPGETVRKGEVLIRIDTSDYKNQVQLRRSQLIQARADLKIEEGRQDVARKDYALLGETINRENESLVLREPQLESAKAAVLAAEANLEQAELNLSRTSVKAPFDAQVITRNVEIGSQISPGTNLGRLVGINTYWISVTLPLSQLRRLSLPGPQGGKGAKVRIHNRSAWPEGAYRTGRLYKMVGILENETRMARVLVEISDPLAMARSSMGAQPLIIGAFVETRIEGKALSGVVRIDRDHLRQDDTVWVMEEGTLRIRNVEVEYKDEQYAYIGEGLSAEDEIVTTNLSTVVDGAPLRIQSNAAISEEGVSSLDSSTE